MSQYFEAAVRPDTAAAAIGRFLRVKTPGAAAVAGALEASFGTMDRDCLAAGNCSVRLRTAQGTRKMVANGAITAAALVYGAASGKVSSSANGNLEGIAMEAATADGDVIEIMNLSSALGSSSVTAYSANGAITVAQGTAMITKTSAAAMTLAAPSAAQEGMILRVVSQTAYAHVVTATGLIDDGVTGGSKNTATFAAFPGASIELVASNLKWAVISKNVVTIA